MAGTNTKKAWDAALGKSGSNTKSAKSTNSVAQKKKIWDELLKADTVSTNRYADASTINWLFDEDADRFHQSYSGQANAGAAYNASKNTQQAIGGIYDRNAGSSILSSGAIPSAQAANSKAQLAANQIEAGKGYISDAAYNAWLAIAGAAYANTDASAQNTLKARSGDASVLTDQRAVIDQLKKEGQNDNFWNRLWGTHSYTNQEEIDAAETEYKRSADLLKLYGMETIRDRKPQTSMIGYTEDDYYADLNTILHKAQGIDIPREDYLEAAKRLRGFVGNTAVEQEAFADPSGQWMDKYRGLYGQRMNTLDKYIDKYSGAAGTEYDFSAEDYTSYQRAYDRVMARKAEEEQALSAAAQKVQDKWGGLENRPDFATYSTHVPTKGGYYDEYDVLNWRAQVNDMVALGANPERFEDAASILSFDPVIDSDAYPYLEYGLQYMTEQDRSRFFYLYNNPEYGPDAALEYLEDIGYRTKRPNTEDYQAAISKAADDSVLTSAALSVAAPFYRLMNSVASLNTLAYKATGREVNPYDPTFLYGTMRDTIVGEVGSNIAEATAGAPRLFGQNIFQMGYNAVMSAAESALNVGAFGSAGTVAMGMSAFNSSYQQGLAAGKSDTDAFIDALVDGAIEVGTEYFSVEAFLSDPTSPMGYFLKNMFTEGAEEGTGTILRTGYDQLKNGIDSAINTRIDELRVMGYSPTEAKRTALKEWLNELGGDMATGAISGGAMSGPVAAQSYAENRSTGKALQENAGDTGYQSLIDLAGTVELSKSGQKILEQLQSQLAQQSYGNEVSEGLSTEAMQDEKNQQAQQEAEDQRMAQVEDDLSAETARGELTDDKNQQAQQNAEDMRAAQAAEELDTEDARAELADDKNQQAQQRGKERISRAKLGQLYREVMQKLDEKAQDVLREFMSFDLSKELQRLGLPVQEAKDLAGSVLRIQDGSFTEADVQAVSGSTEARDVLSAWTALAGAVDKAKGAVSKLAGMLQKNGPASEVTENGESVTVDGEEPVSTEAVQPENEFDVQAAEIQAQAENLLASEGEASTLDGEEVEVLGVAPAGGAESAGAPRVRIRMADGTERSVAAKDIAYGAKDAGVYQLAAYAGKYGRNADQMFNLRLSGQNADDYARAFSKAAQAGGDGRNLSLLVNSGAVDVLTPGQAQAAYDIGRAARAQRSQAQQEALGAKGVNAPVGGLDVSQIERVSLNKQQRASVDAMGKLAKALGINVRFVKSVADESGRYTTENGSYDPNTRTLTLDIHAGSNYASDTNYAVMNTAGHELTHYIRQFADSALWDGYQDFVMDHLDGKVDPEKEIQKRMAQNSKLDRDGAIEEIVADASGEALSKITETQLQELAQENPTLLQKIARFMKKWISNLKRQIELAFKGTEAKTEVARQMQDALDEMAEMWNSLLVEAGKKANQTAQKANQTAQKANPAAAQTTAQATQTKAEAPQEAEKLFIPYAHIDQRDIFSVKEEHTELFCGEVEEARVCYAAAAEVLLDDLSVSVPGQKIYIRDSQGALSVTGQNRTTSDLLARMKDETGWTWDEIRQTLTAFADMGDAEKGYPLVKNTIRNRRMEVYLHEMLTRGYKTLDGAQLAPWREYVEAMAAYQGSKGAGLDVQPPKGVIPFEEYAFADEFADDSDVKYSIRSFADGSQFVHVDTEQEQFEGLTGNELRKKAHEYLIQNFRGKVAGTIVRAYVTGVSERKLLYPNKTQDMRIIEAISKAVPELGNLLDASKLLSSEPDSTTHAHGDKVIGWRKYKTVFEVGGLFIAGVTNIQITQHGDVYYGMSKLKDITNSPTVQAYLSEGDRTKGDVLDLNISQPDDSVKFSLRAPVENSGNLIAVHNLTEEKLRKALKLGGFPMPSIAIAKTDIGHQNFGGISLVFGKDTIDPKADRKNKVYSADVWSPTFPRIEYEVNAKVENRVREMLNDLGDRMETYLREQLKRVVYGIDEYLNRFEGEEGFVDWAVNNYGLKAAFLEDQGQHVGMVKVEKPVGKSYPEGAATVFQRIIDLFDGDMESAQKLPLTQIREEYGAELEKIRPGVTSSALRLSGMIRHAAEYQQQAGQPMQYKAVEDYSATERSIDEKIDPSAFKAWASELFKGIEANSGVYNNKPLYTNAGNRRSFSSTHLPVTVENIAKAMATQGNGRNIAGFNGIKSVRAATARSFKSISEMHAYEGRIQARTTEEAEALNTELNNRLYGLIQDVLSQHKQKRGSDSTYPYAMDALGEIFLEIAETKYSVASIQNALANYGYTVSTETAEAIKQLFDEAAMMPVNMYEAKPERAVGFDEVKFAVVPDNMSADVMDALSEVVPDVRAYPAGDEAARLEQLNSREDVLFQQRDPDQISDRELLATALQSVTQNADEWDNLRRYQKKIAALNEKQRMLEQTDARIAELKGKSDRASKDELIRMQNNARTLARSIERADGELLKYEAMKPIKKLAERQREDYRQKLKERTDERMRKYKERMKQDMQDRIREVRAREAERGKQRLDKAVEHAREVGQRRVDRLKESEAKAKYKERIQKDVSTLREWLTQPTNKGHVPQFLRAPLADFLESLDFTSARALRGGDATKADELMLDRMDALRRALDNTREQQAAGMDSETAFRDYLDLPQGFVSEFDAAIADIKITLNQGGTDIPINRMTAEQLKTLSNMIRTINTAVRKANSFLANRRYQTVSSAAQDTMRTLSKLGAKSARNAILEKAGGFLDWTNATPYYAFKRFGEGGKAVFEGLMDGWDRLAFNSRRLIDYANSCYTTEQVRAWSQELHEIKLDGVSVKMTTAQIMSLYCLNKRAQARGHLLGGGMRIADIKTKGKTITQADNHILGAQDIVNITKLLTAEQRAVADKLQEFMNTVCTDWGNEVSMQRFGYEAFGDEANYFPIESDSNNLKGVDENQQENSLFRLLNLSATKSTIKNANNALVVRDIFDVFSAHCTDMAKYNALALPILDALKWYNYVEKTNFEDGSLVTESVQKALEKAYGKDAQKYIKNFLRDLNGVREGGRNDGLFNRMLSNYKIAAVAANLRVGLLQITSMPRAAYAIDPKYLAIGVARNAGFQNSRRAEANVGICLWKSLGFYDTNISRNVREMVKHDQSVGGKVKEKSMILAEKGDAWTMGVLYGAVEAEMADKRPGVAKGSKAYSEMVNARVREIVYQTQVVDSTMTRSDIMRDTKAKVSLATAFMSEPTLTMNMLADSIYEQRMKARESGKKLIAPSKKMVRAFAVNAVVLAFSSVMEAMFTAWRDDDEYETFAEKFDDSFLDTLLENLNPANNLPLVKDVAEALRGRSMARMDSAWALTLGQGVTEVYKYLTGQSKNPAYNGIYKTLNGLSQMSGFAVGGLTREVVSLYNNLIATPMGYTRIQTYNDSASDAADAILRAYTAGDNGMVARYIDIAAKHGIEGDKLENAIKSATGEAYKAGNIDELMLQDVLVQYAGKTEDEAYWAIQEMGYTGDANFSKYTRLKGALASGDSREANDAYAELIEHGVEEDNVVKQLSALYNSGEATSLLNLQMRSDRLYSSTLKLKADKQAHKDDFDGLITAIVNGGGIVAEISSLKAKGYTIKQCMSAINGAFGKSADVYRTLEKYNSQDAGILLNRILDAYEALGLNRQEEIEWIDANWPKLD